jgi:hypothetical protein
MVLIHDLGFLRRYRIAPEPGGLLDQSPLFLQASDIIDDERARTERALAVARSAGAR